MDDREFTTPVFIELSDALKLMDILKIFSRHQSFYFMRRDSSTPALSMKMERPLQPRKVVEIWDSVATNIMKRDKVVAFCDAQRPTFGHRNCNVISPFVTTPGNRNESPLLEKGFLNLMSTARTIGIELIRTVISLDDAYDSRDNCKAILIEAWCRISMKIYEGENRPIEAENGCSIRRFSRNGLTLLSESLHRRINLSTYCFDLSGSVN
ncbi:hypothetical protein [Acaryochloris sp. IP29b_bin.148]|uniref:hypothetical protein n=1 Tax=Acaryochloris sp. IP29b_bin.148 TaxID=2969218 RepID=UPI002623FC0B|nr:hypothetical protein [Acaryochloris sp. IP29b_bin.148]